MLGLDGLTGLVDKEFHAIQLHQQIVGEFNIGLIDLVDQQNNLLLRREGFPELAALDVLADVLDFTVTQLRVP